ncbi:MAG TPA: hypothetical protein VIZ69_03910 [Thermoanaerobaculia bacterium]
MPEPHRWKLVLSYLPLLGVVPLFFGESTRELRWHARNGILLFAAFVAILGAGTGAALLFPSLSCIYGIAVFVLAIVYAIVLVLAISMALQGQRLVVRGLSRYADRG